jgi:hypothetical protein
MTGRCLILLIILEFYTLGCYSQTISKNDRVRELVNKYGQAEVTIPFSDNKSVDFLTRNISILSVSDKLIHLSLSPLTVEWFILQKLDYQIITRSDLKSVISAQNLNQAMEWDKYPTYSQYDSIMQSFRILYPTLCHLDTIGTSVNGKLVLALKISDNAGKDEDEPEVFYSSTIHGDETGGFILMLRLADYLLKNYNLNPRVKNLIDNLEIWINPLANPDGTYRTGNIISTSSTRYNANGVDLNRNFPDPFQPFEVQQKETKDMMKFMRNHKFVLSANFHSGVEVVNYPWDRYLSKFHADDSWFYNISRAYADTVHFYAGPAYMNFLNNGITRGAVWYIVYGGRQDFVTSELHGREVTIELDDQYITPATQLALLWQNNRNSLVGYLENALYGIHGHVINLVSAAPVQANVFIKGHDIEDSDIYSDTFTGSFTRLLAPGSWDLTFSAIGYKDTTINNLIVGKWEKNDIIVRMLPLKIESVFLYPNPAISEINAILPGSFTGTINIRIIDNTGKVVSDYDRSVLELVPVVIDVQKLSGGLYTIVFTSTIQRISSAGRFIVVK